MTNILNDEELFLIREKGNLPTDPLTTIGYLMDTVDDLRERLRIAENVADSCHTADLATGELMFDKGAWLTYAVAKRDRKKGTQND